MRDVRLVWPNATMYSANEGRIYIYTSDPSYQGASLIGFGSTPKEAWWDARTKALGTVLSE